MFIKIIQILCLLIFTNEVLADRPDAHAPITIMGDHTHKNNEWMLSYRLMTMNMSDLYDGDSKISHNKVTGYMMVPTEMNMKMHMFGAMYGLNNRHSLMLMLPYIENNMKMLNAMTNNISKMSSEGFTDVKISDLINLSTNNWQNSLELGVSLATATIKASYNGLRLPYRMQLGSGTYDVTMAFTGVKYLKQNSIGYQLKSLARLGRNSQGYSLGNKLSLTGWYAHKLTNNLSSSLNISYQDEAKIDGKDNMIEAALMTSPSRKSSLSGGQILTGALGFNYLLNTGNKDATRLAVEYKFPLYQKLAGPQLGLTNIITLGVQQSF